MCDACPHVCKRGWKRLTPRSGGVVEKFSSCTVLPRLNTFKSYNSNPELKQNLFHVRQISRKEECTCHKPNQTQNLCNSVLFYSELIFISAIHITEIKSCLQVDTPMQRWLQRCSRRGKNRCFRQIFRYSWMQLISFEWIRLRVQGKSNIFRIDRQLHLVDLDSNEDQPLIDLTIFCHDESTTWQFYFQIFGYLYSCKSISWNGALFGQPFCLLAGKTSLLILPILTMMWIGTSIGVSRLTTLGTCFLAACIVSSVMLLLLSRWELRSFHANKFPANMELNEEVLRILRFLLNRWIPCVQAHLKSYAIMANYDFGWGIDQF